MPGGKKPSLCRYFTSTGSCSFGDDCQFLHSTGGFPQPVQNTLLNGFVAENEPLNQKDAEGVLNTKVIFMIGVFWSFMATVIQNASSKHFKFHECGLKASHSLKVHMFCYCTITY